MTVIDAIKETKAFLEREVCPKIELLVPSTKDGKNYVEKYANPNVFAFFEPENGRLPAGVEYTTPNIVVQFTDGTENLATTEKRINIVLAFSVWRPGEYRKMNDMEFKNIEVEEQGARIEFGGEKQQTLIRNEDGWQDVYNLMELTKQEIIKSSTIGEFALDSTTEIKYGQYQKDGALIDFYPYYHLWMSFTLTSIPTPRVRDGIDDLL